jgi:glycosyltransferase involved in cell wall biosynthesis
MRILHYHRNILLSRGGIVRSVLDLCGALAARGHEVTLATPEDRDVPAAWRAGAAGAPRAVRLASPRVPGGLFAPGQLAPLRPLVEQADVVHLHGLWTPSNAQVAKVARRAGVPYVLSLHGMLDDFSLSVKPLKKKLFLLTSGGTLLRHAAQVHCASEEELVQARGRLPAGRGVAIPLLFDATPYARLPGRDLARGRFPALANGRPVVLLTGRIVHNKGGGVLAEVAGILKSRGVDVTVALAGAVEGGFAAELTGQCERLGVADRVVQLGMVSGDLKLSVYQCADVFALPSIHENFGLVVPEALCCGVATVVSPGVMIARELAAAGGCVVAERTPEAFAEAIASLLADPARRARLAERGRAWVDSALSASDTIARYEGLYAAARGDRAR